MHTAFVIHHSDNVATLLQACDAATVLTLVGESTERELTSGEAIRPEHKVALTSIPKGHDITKYGMTIGHATCDIPAGSWVHLHNCASNYDERSNTLDGESGAPTDTQYV